MTTYENVERPAKYAKISRHERERRTIEALEKTGLKERMTHKPDELSGGQQQRAAIARALVNKPSILLADEPTGNLDTKSSAEIMKVIRELHAQGNTIVLITHDLKIAEQADRILQLSDGKVVSDTRKGSIA